MLSPRAAIGSCALLVLGACGGHVRAWPAAHRAPHRAPDVLLIAAEGEVCARSRVHPPPCVPAAATGEPVVSATLAPLDTVTDVVIVLTRTDVVVDGLGARASRTTVQLAGRELVAWLRTLPPGTASVCASYRAPDAAGRFVVHRSRPVSAAEAATVEPESGDEC